MSPAVRVFSDGQNQSIPPNISTAVIFTASRFDGPGPASFSPPTKLVAHVAGRYQITGNVEWFTGDGTTRNLLIVQNGGNPIAASTVIIPAATPTAIQGQSVSTLFELAANDFVELFVKHDATGNVLIAVSPDISPEFMMVQV